MDMNWIRRSQGFLETALSAKKQFNMLIFFVTSRCNSRCRTCFYWSNLNRNGDLTLAEIERLAFSMPQFKELWLSGGEPMLRRDLVEIVRLFYDNNGVRSVNLPTNGLLPQRVEDTVNRILIENPGLNLNVNFASDGFGETHDRIRGVKGNYGRTLESLGRISHVRGRHPRLNVFVNSTICRENYGELIDLGRCLLDNFDMDGHFFQIIRGDVMDPELKSMPPAFLEDFYRRAVEIQGRYLRRRHRSGSGLFRGLEESVYLGGYIFCFKTQWENYVHCREWPMECTAGMTSAVIDYNGDFRICELREPIGTLRQWDLDFSGLWHSKERELEVERMKRDRCFCTHLCFVFDSLRYSRRAKLLELPLCFLNHMKPRK